MYVLSSGRFEHVCVYMYMILFAFKMPVFTSSTTKYFKKEIFY
jgi:hypothetical protein